MKKLKIFPKTFLYTLGLMLIIVLLSHALIYFLMPRVYNYQQEKALEADANALADKIISATPDERVTCVTDFAAKWSANAAIIYDDFSCSVDLLKAELSAPPNSNGKSDFTIIADTTEDGLKISLAENPYGGADFFRVEQAFAGGTGSLTATVSRQHIEDAVGAVLMILPFTAVLCIVISVAFAFAYSKMFTKPIKQISAVTEQMQNLKPDVCCETDTQDEIGMLAENVNNLYQNLLSALAQQTNFLRAASHELKTPVTAVSAMLENMILNVGKYKDRDTYLAKCKDLTDRLALMIKEILDASKAEFATNLECTDFLISDVISTVIEPYQIIAKAKGLTMNVTLDETGTVCLPRGIIEKAISNILANAVSYTKPDGTITVSCAGQKFVVENECAPIPPEHLVHIFEPFYRPDYGRGRATGGNGLGLYLVATTLKSLDIPFAFTPSKNMTGMSFEINF